MHNISLKIVAMLGHVVYLEYSNPIYNNKEKKHYVPIKLIYNKNVTNKYLKISRIVKYRDGGKNISN